MREPMVDTHATCSVEVGLLRKKPCGHAAVAECSNCQQPLCAQHAVAQLTEAGKRSGKFLCQDCSVALKDHEKAVAAVARTAAAGPPPAPKPAAKPVAAAPATAPAAAPEALDAIEFTPTKKPEE